MTCLQTGEFVVVVRDVDSERFACDQQSFFLLHSPAIKGDLVSE